MDINKLELTQSTSPPPPGWRVKIFNIIAGEHVTTQDKSLFRCARAEKEICKSISAKEKKNGGNATGTQPLHRKKDCHSNMINLEQQ